ncbi:MAG: leucine-rich repeat domain-containing protein, partial [Holosporales bacterium]|nr:leucine-rich repeat domain-containing protein [Holosporales bacterium]
MKKCKIVRAVSALVWGVLSALSGTEAMQQPYREESVLSRSAVAFEGRMITYSDPKFREILQKTTKPSDSHRQLFIISADVKEMPEWYFHGCRFLGIAFELNSQLQVVRESTFASCTWLRSICIPSGVEELGKDCFAFCNQLASVTFAGSSVRILGEGAFSRSALPLVVIPESVEEIGKNCFAHCVSLSVVLFGADPRLHTLGEGAFARSALSRIVVPWSVEIIGDYCFENCVLANLTFEPDSRLWSVGTHAFASSGLPSIAFPESVESFGECCFSDCSSLLSITFGQSVHLLTMGDGMFARSGFRSIMIPAHVVALGKSCF